MGHRSAGSTLLEIIIAATILVMVMGLVINALLSARGHEANAAALDDLSRDAERIRVRIQHELSRSGWHIPDGTTSESGESHIDPASGRLRGGSWLSADDRQIRYYPYVLGDAASLRNDAYFKHARIHPTLRVDAAAVAASLASATGAAADLLAQGFGAPVVDWYASYLKPDQRLVFLTALTYDPVRPCMTELDLANPAAPGDVAVEIAAYQRHLTLRTPPVLHFGSNTNSDLADWMTPSNHAVLNRSATVVMYPSPISWDGSAWQMRPALSSGDRAGVEYDAAGNPLAYGRPFDSGYLIDDANGSMRIVPQWDVTEWRGSTFPDARADAERQGGPLHARPSSEEVWRERMFAVVRSPLGAGYLGRLVLAYKGPVAGRQLGTGIGQHISADTSSGWAFIIDDIISDNVVRVAFDTYRTDRYAPTDDGNLDINQVRVRVFLARPDQVQHLAMKRLLTFTVTMRAKSAEQQRIDDSILLGTERPGLTRN